MRSVIEVVAEETGLPQWWVEALAVEYTDCRDFASRDEIWRFDFSRVSKADLLRVVDAEQVVVAGKLVHNVDIDVWRTRLLERLVGSGSAPLAKKLEDVVPDGPVGDYHFLFQGNSIESWDPKLGFSSHFQVLDGGRLWQWRVAQFQAIEGRSYGKWVSLEDEVDLEPMVLVHDRLAQLRNPVITPGQPGHREFRSQVIEFYRWLDEIRRPIFESLVMVHERRMGVYAEVGESISKPPLLTRFDSLCVVDGTYRVDFGLEAILFFACVRRVQRVDEIQETETGGTERIKVLDEDYGERAAALALGAACLEAFTNRVGHQLCDELWARIERNTSLIAKWYVLLTIKGKEDQLRLDQGPFQFLESLRRCRDAIMHYKAEGLPVTSCDSPQEAIVPLALVRSLPHRIQELVRVGSGAVGIESPDWLRSVQ